MVRLLVPEGEGQHALVRRHPDPLAAESKLISTPCQSTLYAASATALLALVGKSRPGLFLTTTAYLSVASLSMSALDMYGRRELNRAVFKLDNLEPNPGKLWEHTERWSVDDLIIRGGVLGSFLALNPRALPGVHGWRRFLGAATVGCALGGYVGETRFVQFPSQLLGMMHTADAMTRRTQYERLQQDPKAKASLSRFGKLALTYYTWPVLRFPTNLFGSASGSGGLGAGAPAMFFQECPHTNITQQEMDQHTLIQIEFNKGELKGPDIEHGYRGYKDSLTDRDVNALQEWLQHLKEVRKTAASEAQYVWQHLARKEHEFYHLVEEDREKDILRREIQLLNNMASDFCLRDAVLGYHIADALKRLQQMEQMEPFGKNDPSDQNIMVSTQELQDELPADWKDHYSPQLVVEQVRLNWTRKKELLGFLQHSATMQGNIQPEAGTPAEAHLKAIRQNADDMKKNVEATERLLKEFEDQVRQADEHVKP